MHIQIVEHVNMYGRKYCGNKIAFLQSFKKQNGKSYSAFRFAKVRGLYRNAMKQKILIFLWKFPHIYPLTTQDPNSNFKVALFAGISVAIKDIVVTYLFTYSLNHPCIYFLVHASDHLTMIRPLENFICTVCPILVLIRSA